MFMTSLPQDSKCLGCKDIYKSRNEIKSLFYGEYCDGYDELRK